jgi:hypothetical protein
LRLSLAAISTTFTHSCPAIINCLGLGAQPFSLSWNILGIEGLFIFPALRKSRCDLLQLLGRFWGAGNSIGALHQP